MTTEVLAVTAQAATPLYFGQGRIWYLKTAASAVVIECRKTGQGAQNVRRFINVAAGFKFRAEVGDGWDILVLTSAAGQNIEIIIGDDDVEVSNAVTVNGSVSTQDQPATAVTDRAPVAAANGAQSALFAANLSRRRIRVYADSLNGGSCYARTVGGANNIAELQPGGIYDFDATYGLDVRNDTGAVANFYLFEEA